MALEAQINPWSRFDRKNYFYADLPQGYQISQLYHPIVGEGVVEIEIDEKDGAETKTIGIERIHLEQDAGKLMHDQHPSFSYVDLNRSGVALMEIVSQPDMRSPEEAGAYVRKLRSILRYVGSCDGNMEQGCMRADVNVSVRKPGDALGTRTETKNVNSVRFIMAAIEYEANRQVDLIESGGTIVQETRLFDPDKAETRCCARRRKRTIIATSPIRTCCRSSSTRISSRECRAEPARAARRQARSATRRSSAFRPTMPACSPPRSRPRAGSRRCCSAREPASPRQRSPNRPANWLISDLFGALNRLGKDDRGQPGHARAGRRAARAWSPTARSPARSPSRCSRSCSRPARIPARSSRSAASGRPATPARSRPSIAEVLAANADKVAEYRSGKDKLFGFFVGQTMKAMAGKANPQVVNELLRKALG